ncbi:Uncharacterised protein [Alloiococcus otitis]|uniref:Asparagine synthetase domain-containing protein n=1 Tax=Alloiococcus otitis ATCC 51267 TaxID=883081 RepID=K9EUX5_9LACT|nr:hypothetical protein [Alloiococcus otitis]EKU93000.1 hypothetical protein HMPREF9698_01306 [Alloiococcus otitis ATCC 51267]SUU80862.1 Uncharacterised protein [Alloiococcus otitis]
MDKTYELNKEKKSELKNCIHIANWYIHYCEAPIYTSISDRRSCAILGEFFHIEKPELTEQDITNEIIKLKNFEDVIIFSKYLLGRFVIFYFDYDHSVKILPDATTTIPVYYTNKAGKEYISSDSHLIKNKFDFQFSETSINIKEAADNQHPLPYNITMFEEIKVLIPNHYYDSNTGEMHRYFPLDDVSHISLLNATEKTIYVIRNVLSFILKRKKLSLPLTAGVDSRTVLSFLKNYINDIPTFTFYSTNDTGDLEIAKDISHKMNFFHKGLKRKKLTDDEISYFSDKLDGNHKVGVLNDALTLKKSAFKDRSFLTGDIIPLAKSNFGKNLPEKWATASYLVTKTHNYSRENKEYVKKWLKDVKEYHYLSIYDLFFWEYRFGRWFPNSVINYDIWTDPFYLFNCRYLIELWLSIPRNQRTKYSLHEEIIKTNWPELLKIPINPHEKYLNKFFSNQYLYYLGSFGKYYLQGLKRK